MSALLIVGLQWGDEGKGKLVDWLASSAAHVARFQGGHNAGHTLWTGGKKTVLHLLPSGILHPGAKCYIGDGVVISPSAILAEMEEAVASGASLQGRLLISSAASLVLPYHQALDQQREQCKDNLGTTQRGIGPAHEDKTARRAIRIYDLYNGAGEQKLADNVKLYSQLLASKLDFKSMWQELQSQAARLRPMICDDIGLRLSAAHDNGENILLEGAQAIMLDIEQGTYPYVTSARCLPSAAAGGLGVELFPDILGVSKAYSTRVGNGPFPTEQTGDIGKRLAATGREFGATTGRNRRCGWLDIPMLRRALLSSGCKTIALTKLDVLDGLDEIPICTSYELNGRQVTFPPADPLALSQCRPQYETMPGWPGETTANLTDEAQLPKSARNYIDRISVLTGAEIAVISTGPARESAIVRKKLFG